MASTEALWLSSRPDINSSVYSGINYQKIRVLTKMHSHLHVTSKRGYINWRKKLAWLEIRTSPAHSVVQSTNHWATVHVRIAHRLYMFYMKTVSVMMYTFHNCENYVKVSHDCPTKRDGSSFKTLVLQQSSRIIKVSKV